MMTNYVTLSYLCWAARGVILMRLEHTGKIQSASLISAAAAVQVAED
jgi:hypothetical protein